MRREVDTLARKAEIEEYCAEKKSVEALVSMAKDREVAPSVC